MGPPYTWISSTQYWLQPHVVPSGLSPEMWNHGHGGPTVQTYTRIFDYAEGQCPNSCVVQGSTVAYWCLKIHNKNIIIKINKMQIHNSIY